MWKEVNGNEFNQLVCDLRKFFFEIRNELRKKYTKQTEPLLTMAVVILTSNNESKMKISSEIVQMSGILSSMMENESETETESSSTNEFPIHMKPELAKNIVDFCEKFQMDLKSNTEKFKGIELPLKSSNLTECGFPKWADEYISTFNIQDLHLLLRCADYMEIETLIKLCIYRFASLAMEKKTPEAIKEMFKGIDCYQKIH